MARASRATPAIAADLTGRLILLANRLNLTTRAIGAGSRLAAAVPLPVGHALAAAVADLVWPFWPGIRRRTTENMRWVAAHAPGNRAPGDLARASFRHYLRYLVEFLRFPSLTECELRAVEVRGVENLHAAMALGRGAVAIGFHVGNIDLGAAVLARVGYPVNVVVDRFDPPELDDLIQRQRAEKGLKLIHLETAARQGLRALRQREILALLIDKPTPGEGVTVDLFGGPISIPGGAAVLAIRTGAPLVPCCVFRRPGGRFLAEVAPFVDPRELDGGTPTPAAVTQRLADALERWIVRYPDQWYPFRRMWLVDAPR